MRCSNLGLFWGDCEIKETTLFGPTKTERKFSLRYLFSCQGHQIEVGFQTDRGFHRISPGPNPQEMEVRARSLKLADLNPSGTLRSTYNDECELRVLSANAALSRESEERLQVITEEALLIGDSVSVLLSASQSAASLAACLDTLDVESLLWQRDQLRAILGWIDLAKLPISERIALSANLRLLDEMGSDKSQGQLIANLDKLRLLAGAILKGISAHQVALLNRLTELKLGATEILADVGLQESPDWADLFGIFARIHDSFEKVS